MFKIIIVAVARETWVFCCRMLEGDTHNEVEETISSTLLSWRDRLINWLGRTAHA